MTTTTTTLGILERTRSLHEEIERYQTAIVKVLKDNSTGRRRRSQKTRIQEGHLIRRFLEHICECGNELSRLYSDSDGARQNELLTTAGVGMAVFQQFYSRLKNVKDKHRMNPEEVAEAPPGPTQSEILAEMNSASSLSSSSTTTTTTAMPRFSGSECFGKYFDFNELFIEFQNISQQSQQKQQQSQQQQQQQQQTANSSLAPIDYVSWIGQMINEDEEELLNPKTMMKEIPKNEQEEERDGRQSKFLLHMREYVVGFYKRSQPLVDVESKVLELENEFEEIWKSKATTERTTTTNTNTNTNTAFSMDEEFEEIINPTKAAAAATTTTTTTTAIPEVQNDSTNTNTTTRRTIKCKLCGKEFSKESVYEHHKASKTHKQKEEHARDVFYSRKWGDQRKQALCNAFVSKELLVRFLKEVIKDTKDYISRKQARNPREIEEELMRYNENGYEDEAEEEGESGSRFSGKNKEERDQMLMMEIFNEEDDSDHPTTLTKENKQMIDNYPLGWDGKPIPYWLYKLHGLGVEYKCNICGGMSYWGRRPFERHFQEWRHSHGMALLGIPNTVHFFEITEIEDALSLWQKMQQDRNTSEWKPEVEEECEDSDGNVYSKKLFDALVRQGIIHPKKSTKY